MDYAKIRESVQTIVGRHTALLDIFENKIRDILSADISNLVTNSISPITIQNSINSALLHTSTHAMDLFDSTSDVEYKTIADKLWNPLVAIFLKLSLKEAPSTNVLRPAVPKPRVKTGSTIAKPLNVPISSEVNVERVRYKLDSVLLTKRLPYKNEAHKHIQCATHNCEFCTSLFRRVNITRCEAHKPCHPTGFYPHVGTALWSMLKTKHNKGAKCSINLKPNKAYELPALDTNAEADDMVSVSDSISVEDEERSSRMTFKRGSTSALSTVSEESPFWCESVEDMIERKRRSISVPREAVLND